MNNLVENSSKYKAKQVEIVLNFDHNIEINVIDDGIGIPEEE